MGRGIGRRRETDLHGDVLPWSDEPFALGQRVGGPGVEELIAREDVGGRQRLVVFRERDIGDPDDEADARDHAQLNAKGRRNPPLPKPGHQQLRRGGVEHRATDESLLPLAPRLDHVIADHRHDHRGHHGDDQIAPEVGSGVVPESVPAHCAHQVGQRLPRVDHEHHVPEVDRVRDQAEPLHRAALHERSHDRPAGRSEDQGEEETEPDGPVDRLTGDLARPGGVLETEGEAHVLRDDLEQNRGGDPPHPRRTGPPFDAGPQRFALGETDPGDGQPHTDREVVERAGQPQDLRWGPPGVETQHRDPEEDREEVAERDEDEQGVAASHSVAIAQPRAQEACHQWQGEIEADLGRKTPGLRHRPE